VDPPLRSEVTAHTGATGASQTIGEDTQASTVDDLDSAITRAWRAWERRQK